jgi:hypothetical protein
MPIKVTYKDFVRIGVKDLLKDYYNSSVEQLLAAVYPEYEWLPWRFPCLPKKYWEDINNQIQYVEWVKKQKNFESVQDWYKVTQAVTDNALPEIESLRI